MKLYTIYFITIFHSVATLKAQTYLGLQHSNFGGIHQSNLNPANLAGSRHRMYLNALTLGLGMNNDYVKLNFPFPIMNLFTGNVPSQFKGSNGKLKFDDSWLVENVNNKPKNFNMYLQTRTPGYMITIGKNWALGFQYKNNISFQINDVAESLVRFGRYGIDSSKGSITYSGPNQFTIGQTLGDNAFTINANAYGELGGTIARAIKLNDQLMIKIGITPKFLLGFAMGYIQNKALMVKASGMDTITFGETDVEYGYTDPKIFEDIGSLNLNLFSSKLQGIGFGYDIGTAFEYNPKVARKFVSKNNYLFRGGISLLDAGHITYKNHLRNVHIQNNTGDKYLYITDNMSDAWSHGKDYGIRYTDSTLRTLFQIDTTPKTVKSTLPSTLNLQFDYNIFKFIYIGANVSQDLRGKKAIGVRKASYIILIPRIESRFIEFALPIGIMNDYKNARIGAYLRIGPFFVGSDNLIGQLRARNVFGVDAYFGISAGLLRKKDKEEEKKKEQSSYGSL